MKSLIEKINFISQYRIKFFPQLLLQNKYLKYKKILFHPRLPHHRTVIYKLCKQIGVKIIDKPNKDFDILFVWDDNTYLNEISFNNISKKTINISCTDISKTNVDMVFKETFGYGLTLDPKTYKGKCAVKSDVNALHDGKVIECPVKEIKQGMVYQKIIDNSFDDKYVKDIRVPVFKDAIPFVYFKFKKYEDRFTNKIDHVEVHNTGEVLSNEEAQNIIMFTKKIKLDYGELDVLRDNKDGKIYIIDVNKTPWGPPATITKDKSEEVMKIMCDVFTTKFLA